jgi:hypothetical protein
VAALEWENPGNQSEGKLYCECGWGRAQRIGHEDHWRSRWKWHYANQDYLRNEKSFARVGLVYSQQTAAFYGGVNASSTVEDPGLGFYQALVEARIPFEMVHDRLLDAEHTKPFRTLILPNIAALSDEQCAHIRAFVESGGSVVATYETSLYDEWGVARKDFGLASLFGVSYAGSKEGPMQNSYLSLEKDPTVGAYHPLLFGFEDTSRIIHGIHRVHVEPLGESISPPLRVVPTYPDLPMEECFPRPVKTHDPGVFLRQVGKGRVVYFPADIDRTFWEVLNTDHGKLLANAVVWATNEPAPLSVEGRGVLDISVFGQQSSMTVHLVNLTNPMMMKGPVREVIPLTAQQVRIRIPEGKQVGKARLLVAGNPVEFRQDGDAIVLTVPSIAVHEVIAVDFAV